MRGVLLDRSTGRPVVDERLRIQLADRPEHLERVQRLIGRAVEFPGLVATERNPPLYMDVSNAYSGDELGLPWRDVISEGVVGAADLAVTAHAGANSVDVAAGSGWVLGDTNPALQPNYRIYNDAVVNLGISPDPTNPRRVLVGAAITDQGFAGTGRLWALSAIHGTPAGSPVLPATPASFVPLANVLVPAAAASSAAYTITDMRTPALVGGGQASAGADGVYRKLTSKQAVNTVAETDLLNGEVTLAPGLLGTGRALRLTAWGDWLQNSGAAQGVPRFKAKVGATVIADTNVLPGTPWSNSATRLPWKVVVELMNLGAANSQMGHFRMDGKANLSVLTAAFFTTGEGVYSASTDDSISAQAVSAAALTIDTTVAQLLALTVINPVANALVDVTLKSAVVEIV